MDVRHLIRMFVAGVSSLVVLQSPAAADMSTDVQRFIRSAYFSAECQQAADKTDIHSSNPRVVISAFARELSTLSPDVKAEAGVIGMGAPLAVADCAWATALLINILRNNGIEAELAFISARVRPSGQLESASLFDRVLVYVPALDRYVDAAAPLADQAGLQRIARAGTTRVHLRGPSLPGSPDPCDSTCMTVTSQSGLDRWVRVRTERIRVVPAP